jgi:hypothetical protein
VSECIPIHKFKFLYVFFTTREFTSYYFAARKSCFILASKLFVVNSELSLSPSAEFNDEQEETVFHPTESGRCGQVIIERSLGESTYNNNNNIITI